MSRLLDSLLTDSRLAEAAIADYIAVRDAHPYHRARLSQVAADCREVEREERETAHAKATRLLQQTIDAMDDLAAMDGAWQVQRALEQAALDLDRCYVKQED